jgi:hypothetical protein
MKLWIGSKRIPRAGVLRPVSRAAAGWDLHRRRVVDVVAECVAAAVEGVGEGEPVADFMHCRETEVVAALVRAGRLVHRFPVDDYPVQDDGVRTRAGRPVLRCSRSRLVGDR